MDNSQYQLPPWLMQAQPNYQQSMAQGLAPQMPLVQPQFNIPQQVVPMQGAPMPQQGMDAQKWASILSALAPLASAGQQGVGGYGYHMIPQAERGPANPNYRPQWQLQFTPGQGLQMLSQYSRRG